MPKKRRYTVKLTRMQVEIIMNALVGEICVRRKEIECLSESVNRRQSGSLNTLTHFQKRQEFDVALYDSLELMLSNDSDEITPTDME